VSRLRILLIAPFPPHARGRHGGSRSVANRLLAIARDHDLALLYLHNPHDHPLDADLAAACVEVVAVDRTASEGTLALAKSGRGLVPVLWRTFRGTPVWVQALRSSAVDEAAAELIGRFAPEIIQVEYQVMAQFLPAIGSTPSVLVIHEPADRIAENFATTRSRAIRVLNPVDRRAWSRYERSATDAASRVVVFSEEDASAVHARRRPDVVPMTVPLPPAPLAALGEDEPAILFVGNYGHPPNIDAADWLVREIFPRVRRARPTARLWIVGESAPASRWEDESAGVLVVASVPDVETWLDRAAIFVAPLRLGGGVRVKTVEALAAGKAVVSTSLGVSGLDLSGDELLIADSTEVFAEQIIGLLDEPERRVELAQHARRWAERTLLQAGETGAYASIYADLLAARP
jgi:glycosyltransferase involved in cell wall biosynthesis